MKKVDILGGSAMVREPDDLRGRDRNLIMAASVAAESALSKLPAEAVRPKEKDESDEDFAARLAEAAEGITYTRREAMSMIELREAAVIATLDSWTRTEPLPTIDTIGDLPTDLYDSLIEEVGGVPAVLANAMNFDPHPDPDSPTESSSSSGALLSAGTESPSIPSSLSDGTPTSGESSSLGQ